MPLSPADVGTPRVSVIIATRDRRDMLLECLATYRKQTHPEIEILVVDNGSSDGTAEAVREQFPEIRLTQYADNRGPEALNAAAREATGEYLWRTDDDAYPDAPTTLADAVAFMERFPHVTVVSGDILERLIDFQPLDYYPFKRPATLPEDGLPMVEFWGTCAMIRRSEFLEAGGFWEVFYGEELDLSTRLILNGGSIRYAPWIRVRHLSAFQQNRNQTRRWLLQAEMTTRYQFAYFPMLNALGRTSVVWLGLTVAAVLHRLPPGVYWQGMKAMIRGKLAGRRSHRRLTRAERRRITFGRSIWDVVFRYYAVRWKHRRSTR